MKKYFVLIIVVCSFALLSGCSSEPSTSPEKAPSAASNPTTNAPEVAVVAVAPAPYSWNGTWVTDPITPGMEVKIKGDLITVQLVDKDTKSLFWQGSWSPSAKATDGTVVISKADVEALSASMMGSSEKTKPFTFKNDELTFEFSMMGTTKTVRVKK
jgi:PBP1b-binding outer membrane lipoprotein LpoB